MKSARDAGMQVMVYAAPKIFIRGTPIESRAVRDDGPEAASATGWHTGSNARLYMEQATRLVEEFGSHGLYFDEIYTGPRSLASQYFVARSSRELVGDSGILCYHGTTDALGDGHIGPTCPPLHTWFNFILKGENEWDRLDPAYTRYVLSTYNTSNAIGYQLTDAGRFVPTDERIDYWLRKANVRFVVSEYFFDSGEIEVFRRAYWPRLSATKLKQEVESDMLRPIGAFEQYRQSIRSEHKN
jgi:hypothetical protein